METGLTHTSRLTVTSALTAQSMGSGDLPVLATPAMLALMENAAMLAVAPALAAGETTVGGRIEAEHLQPTAVGRELEATARLVAVEGRKLTFAIEAHADGSLVGRGRHVRFVVSRERFMSKL